jgi:hypothetical protein
VQCLYGPVATWDAKINADGPGALPNSTMRMTCDSLKVYEMETLPGQRGSMGMEAIGNTIVEGQGEDGEAYTARSHKLKYDDAKSLMVFEGDEHGRTDVQLFRQSKPTDPWSPFVARSVLYNPRTRWASTQGFKQLDLSQFGSQPNPTPPQTPSATPNGTKGGARTNPSTTPSTTDDPFDVPGFGR